MKFRKGVHNVCKKNKLRKDLLAIDIWKKPVKGYFGETKWVPASKKEQRQIKAELMKKYPDRYFVDDLREWNSVDYDLFWIDRMEYFEAFMDD